MSCAGSCSLQHQVECSKKHYDEIVTATQQRVDYLKAQLVSATELLSASKSSLNPVMAMIHIVKHILNASIYNLVEPKTGFV